MKSLSRAIAGAVLIAGQVVMPPVAQAAMPPFSVFGESDDEVMTTCRLADASAIAATEAALRAQGITVIPYSSNTLSRDVILTQTVINALTVKKDGVPTGSCAIDLSISVYSNTNFTNPVNKASHFGKVSYCDRSSLLIWKAEGAQAAVNKDIAGFVQDCMKDYADSVN